MSDDMITISKSEIVKSIKAEKNIQLKSASALSIDELKELITKAQDTNDWKSVESANVSKITNMSDLFSNVTSISNLDLSSWDTSNVKNMNGMFIDSDFNSSLSFNTSNVTNMSRMFSGSSFDKPLFFNTSKVKNMMEMFYDSEYDHSLDSFDTSNVDNMISMFKYSVYNYPLRFDTSNVEDMMSMFAFSKYNYPLDSFDTRQVVDMSYMFQGAKYSYSLNSFHYSSIDYTSNMFKDSCFHLPIDNFLEIKKSSIGYDEISKIQERNVLLNDYFETGECRDIKKLILSFEDNYSVLSRIKKASIKNTLSRNKSNTASKTLSPIMRM